MPDPVSRLAMVRQEIDRTFGEGFAAAHPELVAATMASAASDYMAVAIARSLQDIAAALAVEEAPQHVVPARELLRVRP
jgi:hypothetical protein